ncbi:MAG: hypothetical protein HAW61_01855 [Candidatus Portiera sp.]|nr:hypothetical protein [Portiera sp.]
MDIYTLRLISISLILILSTIWLFMHLKKRGEKGEKDNARKRGMDHHSMGPLFLGDENQDGDAAVEEQSFDAKEPVQEEVPAKKSGGLALLSGFTKKTKSQAKGESTAQKSQKKKSDDAQIICLQLNSRKREGFNGHSLLAMFDKYNLVFGHMDVFHRQVNVAGQEKHAFSVINGEAPGTLIPEEIKDKSTQRVMFYISLHECYNPMKSFEEMLDMAHKFAVALDGGLCDDQGCDLSEQNIEYQRNSVREFVIRHRLKSAINE